MYDEIRVRIAPSPTGFFHVGTARTALFNWLYAKKYSGKFILRVEDTDKERSKEEFETDLENSLSWLGLGWDEGPETSDAYGPYRQSERLAIYNKYTQQLLDEDKAYYCFCSNEELEAERKEQENNHQPPKYSGKCRNLTKTQIQEQKKSGKNPAIRFKISEESETVKLKDLIHGPLEFDPKLFGDFVIQKSDGNPTFMFAGIIDDAEMKISHVIRGDDHLSNTPRQILLADALNLLTPEYGHLPLILNPDRTKLSKRKNPVSVSRDFKEQGYLPEAMINFLVLLGWSPKLQKENEIYELKDLINEFDFEQVGKSAAVFDQAKLDYFNGYYIRKLSIGELAKRCLPFLEKADLVKKESEEVLKAIGLVQERLKKLSEVADLTYYFFKEPVYEKEFLIEKKSDQKRTLLALEKSLQALEEETDYSRDSLEGLLRAIIAKYEFQTGELLWPIRAALSGKPFSPGTFELLEVFGKEKSLARIKKAITMLQ